MLVLDASASMAFPLATQGKWVQACRIAIGLAAVANSAGDPIGVMVAGEHGVPQLPPRTRRGMIGEAARLFESVSPAGSASLAPGAVSRSPDAAHRAHLGLSRG